MRRDYRERTLALEDVHWWHRGRRRIVRAALEALPLARPARALDAGCGGGANLAELARLGEVIGLEPSPEAAAAARRRGRGEVVEDTVERMPFPDGDFDLAAALDVIEHLDDDRAGLRELRRVVRPGGFLLLTVPAYPRLYGPHDVVNEHRRRYLRRTLLAAAADAGWEPLSSTYFNSILLAPAAIDRAIQRRRHRAGAAPRSDLERTPPRFNSVLELPLRLEARALAAGARIPAGLSLLATFRRPDVDIATAGFSDL